MEYDSGIDELAASVAHEIKNPLALIKANVQLMELEDSDTSHFKNYQAVYSQVEKINSLLLDFIDLSRPQRYQWEKILLRRLLDDVMESMEASFTAKKIRLDYTKTPDGQFVLGDYNKLKQVFLNILKNAAEAVSEKGWIRITSFQSEGYIAIKIEDNGNGISEQDLERVGKPFFTTKAGGTGLGVSISKRIVEGHKGIFAVSSLEGRGCTVAVTLPEYT